MKTIQMIFSYKGQRNYLQGADIYNEIIKQVGRQYYGKMLNGIMLTFHSIAHNDCDLILAESDEIIDKPLQGIANFEVRFDKGKVTGWLIETNRSVNTKTVFEEERIEAVCEIKGQTIILTGETGYTAIEEAVSMTKKLHNCIFPSKNKRWLFTKIDLTRILKDNDASFLSITNNHNFNNRLTKNEIFSHGEPIGYIYFSLVNL